MAKYTIQIDPEEKVAKFMVGDTEVSSELSGFSCSYNEYEYRCNKTGKTKKEKRAYVSYSVNKDGKSVYYSLDIDFEKDKQNKFMMDECLASKVSEMIKSEINDKCVKKALNKK